MYFWEIFWKIEGAYFKVESSVRSLRVTFEVLRTRLIQFVNFRIRNGDFTERGLAKILGVSQPQIHNVLKGARKLSLELADRVIRKFDITVLDLLDSSEIYEQMLMRGSIESSGPPTAGIGSHVPPKRLNIESTLKKPAAAETRSATRRTGKTG